MKRVAFIVFFLLFACFFVFSTGDKEIKYPESVKLMVLKGPGALGLLPLIDKKKLADVPLDIIYEDSPVAGYERLSQDAVDIAVMPVNLAAKLYNENDGYKMFSVYIWGILYLVGPEPLTQANFAGKRIFLPSKGANPDIMFLRLIDSWGLLDKVEINYAESPLALAEAVERKDADYALLPEPFVSRVLSSRSDLVVAMDIQDMWHREYGVPFPQTCLLVKNEFLYTFPGFFELISSSLAESVLELLSTRDFYVYEETLAVIGLSPKLASFALPRCRFSYVDSVSVRSSVEAYLSVLLDYNPELVGGKLPDDGFYIR
ncbi:ABC transporter substrate-binding protein [Spirochaetia bacterium 38H-sp]|uniref:ABC transporter substrate-binding protein n=1 Tax=Rarispira pelagica TaxID=3141764 RepID=A0ABU9UDJ6_9SPIR